MVIQILGALARVFSRPKAQKAVIVLFGLYFAYRVLSEAGWYLVLLDGLLWGIVGFGVLHRLNYLDSLGYRLGVAQWLDFLIAGAHPIIRRSETGSAAHRRKTPSEGGGSSSATAGPSVAPSIGLGTNIAKAIKSNLIGQAEVAEVIADCVTDALGQERLRHRSGPYILVIASAPGSGRTTMLLQLKKCLGSSALLLRLGDDSATVPEDTSTLLVDDTDKQPESVCDMISALASRPDGPRLLVLVATHGSQTTDPERQPSPSPAEQDRMLSRFASLNAARINHLVVPQVPQTQQMIEYAERRLQERCKVVDLELDIKASQTGIARALNAPHMEGWPIHPGKWVISLDALADRELRALVRKGAKRVILAYKSGNLSFERTQ